MLGYSKCSKANKAYNYETILVEESIHVQFDDKEPSREQEVTFSVDAPSRISLKYKSSYLKDQIIESKNDHLRTRRSFRNESSLIRLLSMIEQTFVDDALKDVGWILAMKEELKQFH